MIIGVAFCGCQAAKVRVFPTRKNCLFFLTGLKMVVGVGFCKIKVDSNFLLVLKIKYTKFDQDRSKTVDLHTKYTNKQTFSFIYIDYIIIPLEAPFINIMFFALSPLFTRHPHLSVFTLLLFSPPLTKYAFVNCSNCWI
jgi:hypothetical protein